MSWIIGIISPCKANSINNELFVNLLKVKLNFFNCYQLRSVICMSSFLISVI